MNASLTVAGVARSSAHRLGAGIAAAGWMALGLMWATGSAGIFGHHQEGVPAMIAAGTFLVGWMVMIAAMMLPSSLPTLARLGKGQGAEEVERVAGRLMAGYFLVWTTFGALAFAGDRVLHATVRGMPWLAERPSLVIGGAAILAGAAELLGRAAYPRLPALPAGAGSFAFGTTHAVDRIRRCWPLMVFAMAIGMSSPVWMVGLTMVMGLELRPRSSMLLRFVGAVVFALGVAVVVEPAWAPGIFGTV